MVMEKKNSKNSLRIRIQVTPNLSNAVVFLPKLPILKKTRKLVVYNFFEIMLAAKETRSRKR